MESEAEQKRAEENRKKEEQQRQQQQKEQTPPTETPPAAPAEQSPEEAGNAIESQYIRHLQTTADSPKQMLTNLIRLGLKVSAEYEPESKRNFFLQMKLLADRIYNDPEQFNK
jgi:hypothetical protein